MKKRNLLTLSIVALMLSSCVRVTKPILNDYENVFGNTEGFIYPSLPSNKTDEDNDLDALINYLINQANSEDFISLNTKINNLIENINVKRKALIDQNSNDIKVGSQINSLYEEYWTYKSKLNYKYYLILNNGNKFASTLKDILSSEEIEAINNRYHETNGSIYYDENGNGLFDQGEEYQSSMYIDHVNKLEKIPSNYITNYTNYITKNCNSIFTSTLRNVANYMSEAMYNFYEVYDFYTTSAIKADLDIYDDAIISSNNSYYSILNEGYTQIRSSFKTAFSSSNAKYFINEFGEDVASNYLEDSETSSSATLELENTIKEQVSSFNSDDINKKELYVQLVNNRNKLINLYNKDNNSTYKNYYEYAFEKVFSRDYSLEDSLNVSNNVARYLALPFSKFDTAYDNNSQNISLVNYKVSEDDLWNALDKVNDILLDSKEVSSHIKYNGLYSFDISPNKYSGSYTSDIIGPYGDDTFMFINCDGTVYDYASLIHEFGHYYSKAKEEKDNRNLSNDNIDISEINSNALELLMANKYDSFINDNKVANRFKNYTYLDSLWAIVTSSLVNEFEYYAYNYSGNLTSSILDTKWSQLLTKYSLKENYISYEDVAHIYKNPGYYISYATSELASIELASLEINDFTNSYKKIAKLGAYNNYLDVIKASNLTSPFDDENLYSKVAKIYEKLIDDISM